VAEQVRELAQEVSWEPNDDRHVLVVSEHAGRAVLVLNPHMDDSDDSKIVLVFADYRSASVGPPNDQARHQHRLYDVGLSSIAWAGEVFDSELVRAIDSMGAGSSSSRHYIFPLKEAVAEVVAGQISVLRMRGQSVDLAVSAIDETGH
jgi:hypothetical protein